MFLGIDVSSYRRIMIYMKIVSKPRYIFMITSGILLSLTYSAFFGFIGGYLMSMFPSASYRIITIFLILIIVSNLYAKTCIGIINYKKDK
jgi:hypothetical protein